MQKHLKKKVSTWVGGWAIQDGRARLLGTFLHLLNTGGLICRWKQITLCGLTGAN